MPRLSLQAIVLAGMLVVPAAVPAAAEKTIVLEDAWSRATAQGVDIGVGFVTIENNGDTPDRLVSASAASAERTEIHEMQMEDGVMRMRPVTSGVPVPAGGSVVLGPGGYHLMFMGLKSPLKDGDAFPASLTFEHAGTLEVTFQVGSAGASGPHH